MKVQQQVEALRDLQLLDLGGERAASKYCLRPAKKWELLKNKSMALHMYMVLQKEIKQAVSTSVSLHLR